MESAPILSTPETRLFDATEPVAQPSQTKSDEELSIIYDIERTLNEIRQGRWKRIALQFLECISYLLEAWRQSKLGTAVMGPHQLQLI